MLTILSLIMDVGVLSEADGNLMTGAGLGPRNIGLALPVRGLPVGVVTWIGHFGLVSAVLACGIGLLQQGRDQAHTSGIRGGMLLLALTALLTFAPHMVAYGPLLDRYALLPSILLVLVVFRAVGPDAIPQGVLRFSAGLIGIGFVASLLLTADFFRWQDARYALIGRLVSSGVAADQIDGGFEYNNLAAVLEGPALSMLLVDPSDRPIRLKSAPGPDDVVVSVEEVSRFFGAGVGHIYAVR